MGGGAHWEIASLVFLCKDLGLECKWDLSYCKLTCFTLLGVPSGTTLWCGLGWGCGAMLEDTLDKDLAREREYIYSLTNPCLSLIKYSQNPRDK